MDGAIAALALALHDRQPFDPAARAEHGRVLEDVALRRRQRVEPGGDQAAEGVGHLGRPRSVQPRHQLLQEERVPARPVEQLVGHTVVQRGQAVAGEGAEQLHRGVPPEGIEVDHDRVVPSLRWRPAFGQLRARGGEHDERQPGGALQQPADDVEDGLVGPVEVGQHHDHRAPAGERRRERQQGAGDLVAGAGGVDAPEDIEPEEVEQALDDPVDRAVGPVGAVQGLGHRGVDLAGDDLLVVAGIDVAGGLDRAGDRPPDVRLAVRDAPPRQHGGAMTLPALLGDVLDQARLAQPGVAEHEQQRGPAPVDRHVQRVGQQRDLVVAADQRGAAAVRPVSGREAGVLGHPRGHRRLPTLGGDGAHRSVRDHPLGGEVGGLPDQHLSRFGGGLEALRGVHDVAHGRVVAAGPQGAHQDLPGVHADPQPHVEPQVGGGLVQRVGEPERGPHRPLGVVLMGGRGTEQRQDGVPHDLVDPAAELLDDGHQPLEAPVDDALDLLGVAVFGQGGEADDVGEQDGDHPPLVAAQLQVGTAARAEPSALGHIRAADRAGHETSVWTRLPAPRRRSQRPVDRPRPRGSGSWRSS